MNAKERGNPRVVLSPSSLRRTAYHEAGHAVLAHYLGLGLRGVTINADYDSDSAGSTTPAGEWDEEVEQLRLYAEEAFYLRRAIVNCAGAEAVRRLSPKSRWRRGAEHDYHWATDALEGITSDEESLRLLWRYAKRRSRLLVENYWPEIEVLATELLNKKVLNAQQVASLLNGAILKRRGRLMQC